MNREGTRWAPLPPAHVPLKAKGSFYCQLQWAHSLSLAAFICICNGPILDPRQHCLVAAMATFEVIGSFYWQLQWAHLRLWAAVTGSCNGPI
jgi:hypothetical protein